jgi:hypothetical protein
MSFEPHSKISLVAALLSRADVYCLSSRRPCRNRSRFGNGELGVKTPGIL